MNAKAHITPEEHQHQIQAYKTEFPHYKQYANVLRCIFQNAFPMAVVQAREKSISSFAEKCVRKFDKYPNPVNMLTDLCGARIIGQTLDLVSGVRKFIEENFTVLEMDNKSESHREEEFGLNDLHYIVQLRVDRDIGVTREELDAIQERKAEIQVRTVLQHAWADILHDRIYKTVVSVPPEWRREANRLAALLEKADQSFGQLADALDSQTSAYEVYLTREELGEEINTLGTILEAEQDPEQKSKLALKLGRVLMSANEWGKAAAHEFYRRNRFNKGETSDESLKPWDQLNQATGFADSNKEQIAFVDNVLRKTGFQIRKVTPVTPVPIIFSAKEIEDMARREHARWMCERTCKGWVYGKTKNSEKKISPYLVDWKALPDSVKTYDCEAVKLFPFLLAKLGYEIYRNQ